MRIFVTLLIISSSIASAQNMPEFFPSNGMAVAKWELDGARQDIGKPAIQNNLAAIRLVVDGFRRAGVETRVVVVPSRFHIYTDRLGVIDRVTFEGENTNFAKINSWLTANNIESLNVLKDLKNSKYVSSEPGLFFRYDPHWTPYGSGEVARIIAPYISGFVSKKQENSYTLNKPTPRKEQAYRNRLINPNDPSLPIEMDVPVTSKFKDLGNLLDVEEGAEVVMLGTSFSAAYRFEEALNFYLQTRVLNYSKSGQGLWEPLTKYLGSVEWKTEKPKVIIWEIPEHIVTLYPNPTSEQLIFIKNSLP